MRGRRVVAGGVKGHLGASSRRETPDGASPSPSVLGAWELTTGDIGAEEAGPALGLGFH